MFWGDNRWLRHFEWCTKQRDTGGWKELSRMLNKRRTNSPPFNLAHGELRARPRRG